ncbi:MAG: DUF6788 family protein [Planctomycetota bacterium]
MKSLSSSRIPKHPTLIRRQLQARLKQLQARGPVLAASLVTIHRKCGRKGCHCENGTGHPAQYLTYKHEGKTHTVYVPKDLITEVKSWIKEHQRLKNLMREVSQRALAQVRTHVTHQRRKAGRS